MEDERYVSKVFTALPNNQYRMYYQIIKYNLTRSSFIQVTNSSHLKGSFDKFRDHFEFFRDEDSKYHALIHQRENQQLIKRKIDSLLGP